jgi:hypothetical protein
MRCETLVNAPPNQRWSFFMQPVSGFQVDSVHAMAVSALTE